MKDHAADRAAKSNIAYLKMLTAKLPNLTMFSKAEDTENVSYKMEGSTSEATGLNLYHTVAVAIQYAKVPKGTFPAHVHSVKEIVILLSGKMFHQHDGTEQEMIPGDFIVSPPDEFHGMRVIEDSEVIAILIPSSGGYPGKAEQ